MHYEIYKEKDDHRQYLHPYYNISRKVKEGSVQGVARARALSAKGDLQ